MKTVLLLLFPLCAALAAAAVTNGTSYDDVIAEKGKPASVIERGNVLVLHYADAVIRLEDGKVVSVKAPTGDYASHAIATPPLPAAPRTVAPYVGGWTYDYAAALADAKTLNKRVFVLFTGSDWCIWCQRLEKEILATPAFAAFARENFVLVKLDYPQRTPQPPALKLQNETLAQRYGIKGYPTIFVLNSSGQRLAQLGYIKGGPEPFIEQLKRF